MLCRVVILHTGNFDLIWIDSRHTQQTEKINLNEKLVILNFILIFIMVFYDIFIISATVLLYSTQNC